MAKLREQQERNIRSLMTHYATAFNDERHDPKPKADKVIEAINEALTDLEEDLY